MAGRAQPSLLVTEWHDSRNVGKGDEDNARSDGWSGISRSHTGERDFLRAKVFFSRWIDREIELHSLEVLPEGFETCAPNLRLSK